MGSGKTKAPQQEHTEELGINPVQEVAGRGGQTMALPPEVQFGNGTLPSHVAGDEASAVLCVDAPPAKPLRAANSGDTLQVQILLVLIAEGVGHSPRLPMKGARTLPHRPTDVPLPELTPEWVGLWGLASHGA